VAFSLLLASPFAVGAQLTIGGYRGLSATLNSTGAWSIMAPVSGWQFSGAVGGTVLAPRINAGTDRLGTYQELSFDYIAANSSRTGSIRAYSERPVVLFANAYNTPSGNVSPFPVFSSYPSLYHLSFGGQFAAHDFTNFAADSPWVFFDGAANTFILSPASDFMTSATVRDSNNNIATGIAGQIGSIPAGLVHQTALVFGQGINQTFRNWGQALTDLSGKQRPDNDSDALLKSISYWTDNGATYYYNPGGTSYSGTLEAVKAEFDAKGIRLGSMQLDSWWYPKGPDNSWTGHSGIWTYSASTALFQPDLATFQTALGTPLITHARWIDANSPYRTQYLMSGNVATDPRYWDDIATYLQSSGVATYEQDWLGAQAHTDLNLSDPYAFLGNMAASMAKQGITIQYCMAEPKHFLQSTNYNNVMTIRTSQDRFGKDRWTDFFYSSRFASAIGAWPFSDVFMSSEIENLIASTLSAGPIGIGDVLGDVSASNLLKSMRADGVIVKPDAAATPVDSVIINDARRIDVPMVAWAWSDFGSIRANYLFAYTRGSNATLAIEPAAYGISGPAFIYDSLNDSGQLLDAGSTYFTVLNSGVGYFVLVPLGKTGIAFLGDKGQFVTLGKKRIPSLSDTGRIDLTVSFAGGEKQRTLFGYSPRPIIATSLAGSHSEATWDPATQMFTVNVHPAASGPAAGTAHVRIVESFSQGEVPAAREGGCGLRCRGGDPIPGANN
jgi:hypothetical protein